jgi:hypothetical protein
LTYEVATIATIAKSQGVSGHATAVRVRRLVAQSAECSNTERSAAAQSAECSNTERSAVAQGSAVVADVVVETADWLATNNTPAYTHVRTVWCLRG